MDEDRRHVRDTVLEALAFDPERTELCDESATDLDLGLPLLGAIWTVGLLS